MVLRWVIDTCVLEEANRTYNPLFWDSLSLLMRIADAHGIVVDHAEEIQREYEPHMPFGSFAREWWIKINVRSRVHFTSSALSAAAKTQLLTVLKFDPDDLKFVGVAQNAAAYRLVSKDSDYNPSVVNYMQEKLRVTFADITSAYRDCP